MMKHLLTKICTLTIAMLLCAYTVTFASSQGTSSTTAATIVDRAEVWLNDSKNEFWSAEELLQWLNEGMIDIVTRSHCLEATEAIDLATTTLEYTITSTYLTVVAVHYVDSDSTSWALKKGSPASVGQNTAVIIPTYWYDWGGKVGIYPTITRTTETITVYYITRPTAIISSANVTTPAIYDQALVIFTVAQAWLKDLKLNKYLQMMSLYDIEMKRIRQDLNEFPDGVIQ
jgi:hypothetical protein